MQWYFTCCLNRIVSSEMCRWIYRNSWHRSVYVSKQELNTNSLCSRSSHNTKHNSGKQLNNYTPYERAKYTKFCCGSGRQTPLLLLSQFFLCPPPPLTTTPDYTGLSGFHYNRNKTKILVFIAALDGLVVNTCLLVRYLKQYQTLNQKKFNWCLFWYETCLPQCEDKRRD